MPRTIRTKVYKFDELSETAKEKAINWARNENLNTDYDWWEFVYDDFSELCKTIGIEVDLNKTYFNGFYHQGSGSAFTASIYVKDCLIAIKEEKWKEYAPLEDFKFDPITFNMLRLCHLCQCDIVPTNRESSVKIDFTSDIYYDSYPNMGAVMEQLESFFEDMARTLNHWLYKSLEKEYEYQTSDEALIETIEANEYEFTADGNRFLQ